MAACIIYLIFCIAAAAAAPGSRRYGIVDGELTTIDKYPFQVAVLFNSRLVCGGVIINSRHVLTAGHCIILPEKNLLIRAGSSFYNKGGTLHSIAESIRHLDYDRWAILNDIGIYRTTSDIKFSDKVKPVKIATPNYKLNDNEPVRVAGWGRLSIGDSVSEQLRHVEVLTVSKENCMLGYEGIKDIVDEMVCTGTGSHRGPCKGDSGGPLLHNDVLVGLVSFGVDCNSTDHPAVYTRVSMYNAWIKDNS